ncbi:hypothetical protein BC830DRAFT_1080556 [Chytriomyces sp. MP71]|nr:hypothetical protein BC830DRAFT_1080556 [Chytriomyces sp. MP71]
MKTIQFNSYDSFPITTLVATSSKRRGKKELCGDRVPAKVLVHLRLRAQGAIPLRYGRQCVVVRGEAEAQYTLLLLSWKSAFPSFSLTYAPSERGDVKVASMEVSASWQRDAHCGEEGFGSVSEGLRDFRVRAVNTAYCLGEANNANLNGRAPTIAEQTIYLEGE